MFILKEPLDKKVNNVYFFYMKKSSSAKVNEKRARKINSICDTALDVVLAYGLEGLSMHEVARRRRVTVGALYRYFDSKQRLVATLEIRCLDTIQRRLEQEFSVDSVSATTLNEASEILSRVIQVYRDTLRIHPAHGRLISGILANPHPVVDEEDRSMAVAKMFETLSVPVRVISRLQEQKVLSPGDAVQRALLLWLSAHGVIQLEKFESISEARIQTDRLLAVAIESLVLGWSSQAQFR